MMSDRIPEGIGDVFKEYKSASELPPQERGYEFERVFSRLLELYLLEPRTVSTSHEQIDITTKSRLFFELRWRKSPSSPREVGSFHSLLEDRPPTIKGVFISMSGYTEGAVKKAKSVLQRRSIILLDNDDMEAMVSGKVNLIDFLDKRFREAEDRLEVYLKGSATQFEAGERKRKDPKELFCETLGLSDKRFRHIDEVFVPPADYELMLQALRDNVFVIIVGEPMTGKTFCSLNLLYESSLEGYSSVWVHMEDLLYSDLDIYNYEHWFRTPKTAIYFEDPFGKTDFTGARGIFRDLNRLAFFARTYDVRVVMSSRQVLFHQALQEQESPDRLKENADWFKISVRSYTSDDLESMIRKYAGVYQPRWSSSPDTIEEVVQHARGLLDVPYSVERFVAKTLDISDHRELEDLAYASRDSVSALAEEFSKMRSYEKLFFHLVYLFHPLQSKARLRRLYEELTEPTYELTITNVNGSELWMECLSRFGDRILETDAMSRSQYSLDFHRIEKRRAARGSRAVPGEYEFDRQRTSAQPRGLHGDFALVRFAHPIYEECVLDSLRDPDEAIFFGAIARAIGKLGRANLVQRLAFFFLHDGILLPTRLWNDLVAEFWDLTEAAETRDARHILARAILEWFSRAEDGIIQKFLESIEEQTIPLDWRMGQFLRSHLRDVSPRGVSVLEKVSNLGDDYAKLGAAICIMEELPQMGDHGTSLLARLVLDETNSLQTVIVFTLLNKFSPNAPQDWLKSLLEDLRATKDTEIAELTSSWRSQSG